MNKNKISVKDMFDTNLMGSDYSIEAKSLIKINALLNKIGIKKVLFKRTFDEEDNYFNDLTLLIYPVSIKPLGKSSRGLLYDTTPLFSKDKDLAYNSRDAMEYKKYTGRRKQIMVTLENRKFEIGCYLKERNLIILNYNIFYNYRRENLKAYLYWINSICDFAKKEKIKKVNITPFLKKRLIEKFVKEGKNKIENERQKMEVNKNQMELNLNSVVEMKKNNIVSEQIINSLNKFLGNITKYIKLQIEEVKKLKFVKSVELDIQRGAIKIDVGQIYIKDRIGVNIYIGDFILYLCPDSIKIVNEKNQVENSNYAHPHISGEEGSLSNCCFGKNRKNDIMKYLANGDYKKLTYLLYLFLKNYVPNDCLKSASYWGSKEKDEDDDEEDEEGGDD